MRLALIGCGRQMRGTLVPYLRRLRSAQIEVCVDLNAAAASEVAELSGARRWATSLADVDLRGVDAAIVALPAPAAYETTLRLLEARVPCFVEKPPAPATAQIERLLDLAADAAVPVQIGFNFRFAESIRCLYDASAAGRNHQAALTIEFRSKHPNGPEWGVQDTVEAWLRHNGIHALDIARFLGGEIAAVTARQITNQAGRFLITALAAHAGGSVSVLQLGNLTDSFELKASLLTSALDQYTLPHLGEVFMTFQAGALAERVLYRTRNLDDGWGRAGYGPELAHFLGPGPAVAPAPTLLDALRASEICDAILASLATGQTCAIHRRQPARAVGG